MIRAALRGLRGRLLLSFVATSAVTLIVAAAITLGPLQSRLRDEAQSALQATTEDLRGDFTTALSKTAKRSKEIEEDPDRGYAMAEQERQLRAVGKEARSAGFIDFDMRQLVAQDRSIGRAKRG